MKVYGITNTGNPILLDVISAEIDIFSNHLIFTLANGEIWKAQYTYQSDARMMLIELKNTGLLNLENSDGLNYKLMKAIK